MLFSSPEIVRRLVQLIDFNQNVNEEEAEFPLEVIMEVSFYGLLAVINLTHENMGAQDLVGTEGGIEVVLN